jgi:hypothetical protein
MCEGESDEDDDEEDTQERRRDCRDMEAVDFTGCISAVFVNALNAFVQKHLAPPSDSDNGEDANRRPQLFLPGIQRLSLRGVKSVPLSTLNPFVLSLPSLTHLDLSGTRVSSALLRSLAESPTMRLKSLALARCPRLTGDDIVYFLTSTPVTACLTELNLYNDQMYVSPLSSDDLARMFARAPCFASGKLIYLDLSNAPLTADLLRTFCPPQSSLRSLGLSFIPDLPLPAIADFLRTKAPNVEVLTLIATSPELECGVRVGPGPFPPVTLRGSPRQASVALHAQFIQPLCTKPFSLMGAPIVPPPTRLRVIELSMQLLTSLGAGAGSWRIVKSKGGRGWYVDTAAGWVTTCGDGDDLHHKDGSHLTNSHAARDESVNMLRRDLEKGHPLREELERLADANGNVTSGVGWHARKMEVSLSNVEVKLVMNTVSHLTMWLFRCFAEMAFWDVKTGCTVLSHLHIQGETAFRQIKQNKQKNLNLLGHLHCYGLVEPFRCGNLVSFKLTDSHAHITITYVLLPSSL